MLKVGIGNTFLSFGIVAIDGGSENKFVSLFVFVLFTSVVCEICCDMRVLSGEEAPVLCVGVTGDSVSIKHVNNNNNNNR